jgi:hypothetical protein
MTRVDGVMGKADNLMPGLNTPAGGREGGAIAWRAARGGDSSIRQHAVRRGNASVRTAPSDRVVAGCLPAVDMENLSRHEPRRV